MRLTVVQLNRDVKLQTSDSANSHAKHQYCKLYFSALRVSFNLVSRWLNFVFYVSNTVFFSYLVTCLVAAAISTYFYRFITEQILFQHLQSSIRAAMTSLFPTMWRVSEFISNLIAKPEASIGLFHRYIDMVGVI